MNDSDHLLSLGCPQFSCAQSSAWKWAGKALCPHGLPWKGATYLRLGVHSPLLPASGPLLPRQGPKLFLGRVLVSEETKGRDRQSGKELPCELPWRVHSFHQILRKGPKPKPGQKEFQETDLQLE